MLEIKEQKLGKAIEKARQAKPLVKVLEFRTYAVTNKETGAKYTVRFEKIHGKPHGECTCRAAERGLYCYHLAASLPIHLVLSRQILAAKV